MAMPIAFQSVPSSVAVEVYEVESYRAVVTTGSGLLFLNSNEALMRNCAATLFPARDLKAANMTPSK